MNKLQRSNTNRMVSGVCGGIGEYFNIDPTIVRIIYIFLAFNYFSTALIIYLVCSFVIPEDDGIIDSDDYHEQNDKIRRNTPIFIGGGLIIWGAFLLAKFLFPWFNLKLMQLWKLWPVLLILLGLYILYNSKSKDK